ncbi:unnamed protein product [Cylicocyclus nassatus]|uniref:C2H2-type domain-containing protein n=1 Tax=Cylicocyclus nassatus TaxID=53992 RepID=A0AA36GRJ4_CYLNA|nr:unnamed protein product [Cylicocyclus nassatus]
MEKNHRHPAPHSMSLCLLTKTTCGFCGFSYQNHDDLIAHIEYSHIPAITSAKMATPNPSDASRKVNISTLSEVCRLFTTPYNPAPCTKEEPVRLTFNHYQRSRLVQRSTPTSRDVSPCPIEGCGMVLESNDEWRTHLRCFHGLPEKVQLTDISNTSGRPHFVEQQSFRCVTCRKYFRTERRFTEHKEKCHKKRELTVTDAKTLPEKAPQEKDIILIKAEPDDDIFESSSPVIEEKPSVPETLIKEEPCDDQEKQIATETVQAQTIAEVQPIAPPSEQMFTNAPTSGHHLRQLLMQHRRTLMEDELNQNDQEKPE